MSGKELAFHLRDLLEPMCECIPGGTPKPEAIQVWQLKREDMLRGGILSSREHEGAHETSGSGMCVPL